MNTEDKKLKRKYHSFKYAHKNRGFEIDLSFEEFKDIYNKDRCSFCSIKFNDTHKFRKTVDIINPHRRFYEGITCFVDKNNIQVLCQRCNSKKGNQDQQEFMYRLTSKYYPEKFNGGKLYFYKGCLHRYFLPELMIGMKGILITLVYGRLHKHRRFAYCDKFPLMFKEN